MRGLANRDHKYTAVGIQVVEIFSYAQDTAFTFNMAHEGLLYACLFQYLLKPLSNKKPHAVSLLRAVRG